MNKDNCIITIENGEYYILILNNKEEKEKALQDIKNDVDVLYGCSIDITPKQFEFYKSKNYTIVEL